MTGEAKTAELVEHTRKDRHVDKRQKWILFALFLIVAMLAGGLAALYVDTRGKADEAKSQAVTQEQEKVEVAAEAQEALCGSEDREIYDRVLCEKWAGIASAAPSPPKVETPATVSRAQIVDAFRDYCAAGNCRGVDGGSPTAEDIAGAFSRFCADGRCTGEDGAPGLDGPVGEPGLDGVPGVDGVEGKPGSPGTPGINAAPPSEDMVLAAVTTYCGSSKCVGPAGPTGPPPSPAAISEAVTSFCATGACVGPQGAAGPVGPPGAASTVPGPAGPAGPAGVQGVSIESVSCVGVGSGSYWQIVLTDGQVLNGGGPCNLALTPAPVEPGGTIDGF